MRKNKLLGRIMGVLFLVAIPFGFRDWVRGVYILVPAAGLLALAGLVCGYRKRKDLYLAFGLAAFGALVFFSIGTSYGLGDNRQSTLWWFLVTLPYFAGIIMAFVADLSMLIASFRKPPANPTGRPERK